MTFLTILETTEILCSFKLVPEEKTGKEIPDSLRLEFLENVYETILFHQIQKATPPGRELEEV